MSLWPLLTSPGLQAVDSCSRCHPLILQHANSSLQFVLRRQVANSPKFVRHRQCAVLTCVLYVHIVCLLPPMTWLLADDFFNPLKATNDSSESQMRRVIQRNHRAVHMRVLKPKQSESSCPSKGPHCFLRVHRHCLFVLLRAEHRQL